MLLSRRFASLRTLAKDSLKVTSRIQQTLLSVQVPTFHFSNIKPEKMEFKAETKDFLTL